MLFERHEPPVRDTPQDQPESAEPATPTPLPSRRGQKRSGLQRRADDLPLKASESQPAVEPPQAPESQKSSTPEATGEAGESAPPRTGPVRPTAEDDRAAAAVPMADREAVRVIESNLDLHLDSHTGEIAVRARLVVRNDGAAAMARVPLQISSALRWQSARLGGAADLLPVEEHLLATDLDHTGAATEATLLLPRPLAPGASASLDMFYEGRIVASAERLLRLGAPEGQAGRADWDTISDGFTGLRGAGNVLWYPSASRPAFLGEGVAFTEAVDRQRMLGAQSRIRLRLTLSFAGAAPDAAFFLGERQPLRPMEASAEASNSSSTSSLVSSSSSAEDAVLPEHAPGIAVAEWPMQALGVHLPSLFLAGSAPQETSEPEMRPITDKADAAAAYAAAAAAVRPLLSEWLGATPSAALTVLDLPAAGATPFSDGRLLVTPMRAAEVKDLAPSMAYALATAWLPSGISDPWLRDGVAEFMRMLYVERTSGRESSLVSLAADGDLLAKREAFATGESAPLQRCGDAVCIRTKAAYVLEMLRTLAGEDALKQAISGWRVGAERDARKATTPEFESLLSKTSGKDLRWFFADWIDADHGLPELTIVTVAPRRVERAASGAPVTAKRQAIGGPIGPEPVPQPGDPDSRAAASTAPVNGVAPREGSWLVAVEVANNGSAAAEVPVSIRSGSLINTVPLRVPAHGHATVRVPFEAEPEEVVVNDGFTPELRTNTHRKRLQQLP